MRAVWSVACVALIAAVIAACSSETFHQAPSDAGTALAASPFCRALDDYFARCFGGSSCVATNRARCPELEAKVSDVAKKALTACGEKLSCATIFESTPCTAEMLNGAQLSKAHQDIRKDYCERCGAADRAACESDFYRVSASTFESGVGYSLLFANSEEANRANRACQAQCGLLYAGCFVDRSKPALPPNACSEAGTFL